MNRWIALALSVAACSPPSSEGAKADSGAPLDTDLVETETDAPAIDADDTSPLDGSRPCDTTKAPSEDPCVLAKDVGVFVSVTGNDDAPGDGSRFRPYKTFAKALAAAKAAGKNVFACAEKFTEPVTMVDGVHLYGGVDCKGGAIAMAGRTELEAIGPVLVARGTTKGVRVQEVYGGTPAEAAKLQAGDVIIAVDGALVGSIPELQRTIQGRKIGAEVVLTVLRGGAEQRVPVTLAENPND